MKTLLVLVAALSAHVALAADSLPSQTFTCRINTELSNILLGNKQPKHPKKNDSTGYGIADAESFQVKISDGKIVGGYLKSSYALGDDTWEFDKAGPGADTQDGEAYSLRDAKAGRNGHITTGFDMDGWDHYNYSVDLNPNNNTATVREDIQLDCCDPAVGLAVYDCDVSSEQ